MSSPLSKSEVLYLQRCCAVCGIYDGPLDGRWTDAVHGAEQRLAERCDDLKRDLGSFDTRTERNIATLIPPAQEVARRFMAAAAAFPLTVRIISGSRSYAEQDALYAIGRTVKTTSSPVTKAKGGQSNHNFGIAWDVGLFDANGRYLNGKKKGDEQRYSALGEHIKAHVAGIEWGGDWKSFIDRPHYQLATGKPASGVRSRFEAGRSLTD